MSDSDVDLDVLGFTTPLQVRHGKAIPWKVNPELLLE